MRRALNCGAAFDLLHCSMERYGDLKAIPRPNLMCGRPVLERSLPMLLSILQFIQSWKRYNASLRELSQLGDRELADIGLARSDIPRVAWEAAHQQG
jgi:uncharacterized protein YjiS (DUF1127 family)